MIHLIILSLLQIATPNHEQRDELRRRVEASIASGTGGPTAEYALCQIHAVVEFYDGHITPGVIPDAAAWQRVSTLKESDRPELPSVSADRRRILLAEQARLQARFEEFDRRSKELAQIVATTSDPDTARRDSKEYSNQTAFEMREMANAGLRRIRKALGDDDRRMFNAWLNEQKKTLVLIWLDHHRIENYRCD